MNDVFVEYIMQAEDELTSLYRRLEQSPNIDAAIVQCDIASVVVLLYGLRRSCRADGAQEGALPHPIVFSGHTVAGKELTLACGAD